MPKSNLLNVVITVKMYGLVCTKSIVYPDMTEAIGVLSGIRSCDGCQMCDLSCIGINGHKDHDTMALSKKKKKRRPQQD